jgi:Amt family ammonium transporter
VTRVVGVFCAFSCAASATCINHDLGLGFFYGGMVGKKNVISTMLQSFMAMIIVTILWVVIGFGLSFGPSIGGIIGNLPNSFKVSVQIQLGL